VVASAVDPHFEVVEAVKYAPLMVSVKAAPPAAAAPGFNPLICGAAGLVMKVAEFDEPTGETTEMPAVPELPIRLAGMDAFTCVGLT
jgi:hypothetical protein